MARPKGTNVWPPIPKDLLWDWYWEELLTPKIIGRKWGARNNKIRDDGKHRKHPTEKWVIRQLRINAIPQRSPNERSRLWQGNKETRRYKTVEGERRHRLVFTKHYGQIPEDMQVHHKDHIQENDHPLNLELVDSRSHTRLHVKLRRSWNTASRPARIPIFEVYMRMAEQIAQRSHHGTVQVGCVITSFDLRRVLAVGFNGNAKGMANDCDCDRSGESGTIHAEENALLFAGEHGTDRVVFLTHSPCLMCVKRMINAGIKYVYYREDYRDLHPLKVARYYGIQVCKYTLWSKETWCKAKVQKKAKTRKCNKSQKNA